ncbi:ATP-dependent DNA helicase RecG [Terracidiphilus gabretensis]|uniref:ATP-dependent DNA helicase RecG n=1 Tax=Terracidiphilus gabretensis TaxID=1577687 RepID=UPI0022B1A913|nr:ATP-dependent DNA helicase RecG [Terracidiphilus gabretensis]
MNKLEDKVMYARGVGPKLAEVIAAKGIVTMEDLLYHLPFRYEDRQNPRSLDELKPGEMASVIAEVRGSALLRTKRAPIFEITIGQGQLAMKCMWFNGTYLQGKFQAGQTVAVFGKVEPSRSTSNMKMINPQWELLPDASDDAETRLLEVGRITPVYESLGSRLASRWQRKVIFHLLESMHGAMPECLPAAMIERMGLPDREMALREVHFPPEGTAMMELQAAVTPAYRRLIFEELFFLELGLELKRRRMRERAGVAFKTNDKVREAIREVLPFHPTAAQKKALGEIVSDMKQPSPMRRLLQGDVGSGKTIVALQAMLVAMENGYQAALMAPTEILATQHYLAARKLLERSSRKYRIVLLTGSLDEDRKRYNRGLIHRGEAHLVIGTHALIEEKVEFDRLGLIVVDEQHRFGVMQRFKLMKKPRPDGTEWAEPDVLVMTATPIPRTLALSLYGDLDLSVLDELPPGRTPIVTRRVADERADEVWEFVRKQVKLGRQAYIVYPVIEGAKDDQPELDFSADADVKEATEKAAQPVARKTTRKGKTAELFPKAAKEANPNAKLGLKSAVEMYEKLRTGPLNGLRLGLLHGRLDADEKEIIMRRFQRGDIDVLVSTTVIEVGVDVPNASVMVIEHAERFGLAQMHQLRGRVGRGAAKSYCILMTGARVSEQAEERLNAMVSTQDGFELAELDLAMRGPGEVFGTRQAGLPDFRVANLVRDRKLLELAKMEAARFVNGKPDEAEGTEAERARVWVRLKEAWQRKYGLVEAG